MKKISETMAFKVAYCHGVDKQVENLIYNEGCTPEEALKRVNIHLTDEECEEFIENELLNID
jgi:hypothetical protein